MRLLPTPDDFAKLAAQGNVVPVYTELTADTETPVSAYAKLSRQRPAFLFESVTGGEHIGRYSFVGSSPSETIAAYAEQTVITKRGGKAETVATPSDPLSLIESRMQAFRPVPMPDMPPFIGGAVGFLAHEYVHRVEPTVPEAKADVLGMPLLWFALMDTVVVFDNVRQLIRIVSNAHIEAHDSPSTAYAVACQRVTEVCDQLRQPSTLQQGFPSTLPAPDVPAGNVTQAGYERIVQEAKEYIRSGDIIQVVASQRFERPYKQSPLDLYRALRIVNPSPYMFILDTGSFSVVGASPEVHVRSTHGDVEIRPIAGTRHRGANEAEDRALEAELLADPKERAEHLMLVDLARNDIGRVCEVGSVRVEDYAFVERYSHVMHIVSQIEGKLQANKTAFDLMRATFPAGTLSGAPKVRALQLIADFETQQRGVYGGALGYFSYDGNLDSCIAIRTALVKDDTIYIQSGAGLVADSDPTSEYQETVNKAKGMLKAIALSETLSILPS